MERHGNTKNGQQCFPAPQGGFKRYEGRRRRDEAIWECVGTASHRSRRMCCRGGDVMAGMCWLAAASRCATNPEDPLLQ
eukprot:scaffold2293_cov221-Pinguiococcus_pyrenoidosus.AAC.3